MLSKERQKLVKALHTKKGRKKHGLCLVEGQKVIETAGEAVEFTFSRETVDSEKTFLSLVTTETPQEMAAVAQIPAWSLEDVTGSRTIVLLDGVQDPGNVGAILRLCLGFNASLILVESADPTSPKVIRSSVGAVFQVPWVRLSRSEAETHLKSDERTILRLDQKAQNDDLSQMETQNPVVLIAGNEGSGVQLDVGEPLAIRHREQLESLNVAHAVAVVLHARFSFLS